MNITLDGAHARELATLAARVHVDEGTLARSLLGSAIDDLDPDPANVAALLDGIDGASERAQLGAEQAADGDTVAFDGLEAVAQVDLARAAVSAGPLQGTASAEALPRRTRRP